MSVTPTPDSPSECNVHVRWTLAEDRTDLTKGTLYLADHPQAITTFHVVEEINPYVLSWDLSVAVPKGTWYLRMTVSTILESDYSNEAVKEC